jgi:hypothetical protein
MKIKKKVTIELVKVLFMLIISYFPNRSSCTHYKYFYVIT